MSKIGRESSIELSKETLQRIISFLVVFLSFWLLNAYLMYISGVSPTKSLSLWVSNSFFSVSWIFAFVGIIFYFQGIYRRVIYVVLFFIFSVITCLESIAFMTIGEYVSFDRLGFSVTKIFESINEVFILYFFIACILLLFALSLFKRQNVRKRDFYQLSFFFLAIIFLFGICRGIAYYSMGPQIVYTSSKESHDLKTTYLEGQKEHLNFKISGLYDFAMRDCYHLVLNQLRQTNEYLKN